MGSPAAAAGDEPRLPEQGGHIALICFFLTLYLILNIGLNFYNNWLLSPLPPPKPGGLGFPSALLYTMCHMIAGVLGSSLLMALRPELGHLSWAQFSRDRGKLMSLSLLFCVSIGTSNMSLAHIGLSVNQVIKSSTVLFVVVFAYVLERKTFSPLKLACILLIVGGVVLSIPYGTANAELEGVVLCLVSTVVAGLKVSLGALLMHGSGLPPMVLVWYESFFSIFYLAAAALALGEPAKLAAYAEAGATPLARPHPPSDALPRTLLTRTRPAPHPLPHHSPSTTFTPHRNRCIPPSLCPPFPAALRPPALPPPPKIYTP